MAPPTVEVFDDVRASVGESPLWRSDEAALYWVDIAASRIARRPPGGARSAWLLPERVGFIAAMDEGVLLAGLETGLFAVDVTDEAARVAPLAAIAHPRPGMRCNDGRCDRQGRLWFGTLAMDMDAAHAVGRLHRYADGVLSAQFVDDLLVQNGLAFSPRGDTLYLSDSHPSQRLIWAFDYDAATGEPSRRRVFADLHAHVGRPDGAAVDADGAYWTCANDGGALLRFTPDGALDRRVELPVAKPSMCAFGGARLDTLFVTSIRPADAQPGDLDGCVFAVHTGATGIAETRFKATQQPQPAAAVA